MGTLREWMVRLLAPFRRRALERQSEVEMEFHLAMEIEAAERLGISHQEAEREARLRAGSLAAALDEVRDRRGLAWLDGTGMDLCHAWNTLRHRPGFFIGACGALSFAVAANTLIFTIVRGVLLEPLPYSHPERLARVFEATPRNPKFPISIYNYLEDRRANRTLDGIALYTRQDMQFMHGERAERLTAVQVTDDFFPTLGVQAALGRNFTSAEMHKGVRVVMLSHSFWRTRFGGDPGIVGRTLRLDREAWTVIGVLPAGFEHVGGDYRSPLQGDTVAVWCPLALDLPQQAQQHWHFTNAVARLQPGVSLPAAREDLNRIMDDLARRFPDAYGKARARVEPLSAEVVGGSRLTIEIVMVAGALVLLVACVNIAGLGVARALARRRELAVRQVLGGGAWRLARAVLSENLVLGMAGGLTGLVAAAALMPVLHSILPADFPRLHAIRFSWPAGLFAVAVALATSVIAGLLPAMRQIGVDLTEGLSEDPRTSAGSPRTTRLRGALVAAEVALACVLCFGALLLARSSAALGSRDQGFDARGVLTFQLALPPNAYNKPEQLETFYREAERRWSEIPGVRAVGLSTNLPWAGYDENTSFDIEGRAPRPGESIQARFQAANAGFFPALRFRLLQGRFIQPSDHAKAPPVVVVNETLARRFFPDGNALGRYLEIWGDKRRIVGIVADVRDRPADAAAEPGFWWPIAQRPFGLIEVAVRTAGDPMSVLPGVRTALESLDRELPMAEVRSMEDIAARALAERRFALWLCEAFAALAMLLAAIGVYGMLTYIVEQRRREIGIRLALGATRGDVLWLVLSNGVVLAGLGIAGGLAFAPLAGWAMASLLYGVTPGDVVTLATAPLLIAAIALAGSIVPGWVAARSQPMSALRQQ